MSAARGAVTRLVGLMVTGHRAGVGTVALGRRL